MSDQPGYHGVQPAAGSGQQPLELPLLIFVTALLVALAAATVQLFDERAQLVDLRAAQALQVQQGQRFREQLGSLGSEIAKLADGGNTAAKKTVEAMRQQGVSLKAGN
jgi:hypothetical protein